MFMEKEFLVSQAIHWLSEQVAPLFIRLVEPFVWNGMLTPHFRELHQLVRNPHGDQQAVMASMTHRRSMEIELWGALFVVVTPTV